MSVPNLRQPCRTMLVTAAAILFMSGAPAQETPRGGPVRPLAQEHTVVYESPEPETLFCYSPGLARLEDGRLVATIDLGGPGAKDLPGPKFHRTPGNMQWQGRVFVSDDSGATWRLVKNFAAMHARPFVANRSLYVLGQAHDLVVMRSNDRGETWSKLLPLTTGQRWHQAPCNVHYTNGCVYLVMERYSDTPGRGWPAGIIPVLLRAQLDADLTDRRSWTFATELPFYEVADDVRLDHFGVPFFKPGTLARGRSNAPVGWLETNVAQIRDPDHYWHDPADNTFHLLMRAHTGGTGFAALAKVVEQEDGSMQTMLQETPAGGNHLFLPLPGGHLRFHIVYDDDTELFWLLSSQAVDSMTRVERLPPDRYGLPNNERHRLQLHFSKNLVDWCFAGIVAMGHSPREARHYAAMTIDGEDLIVLSRSGDARAKSSHDGNLITFHRIHAFRSLVY